MLKHQKNVSHLKLHLKQKLTDGRYLEKSPLNNYVSSAVLVPLLYQNKQLHLLYTKRSNTVKNHKNQISFPGGVREKHDKSILATALRETYEEINIHPHHTEVLGGLSSTYTPTGYHITAFLGIIHKISDLHANPSEIQEIIKIPVQHLLNPKNRKIDAADFYPKKFAMPYFQYKKHLIWGATGRITLQFVELMSKLEAKSLHSEAFLNSDFH